MAASSDIRPVSTPPASELSPTNLSRDQAQWRAEIVQLTRLEVTIDLSGAAQRDVTGFNVRTDARVTIARTCQGLWLDFLGEDIHEVSVDGSPVPIAWDGARVVLPLLTPGEHLISVDARGRFSRSGQGLHRFHDPVDGNTYLYTHFEPSDARRAWPCFDQPDIKAPFALTVVHPEEWTILANGVPEQVRASQEAQGMAVTRMSLTQPLPSYLTAMAAGPWHRVESQWQSQLHPELAPVPLSWSCRASVAEHLDADELLQITRDGLDFYDDAYRFPYPWGSYDCVLVPEYNIGAMENPGCVTFSERAYLFESAATRAQHAARANTILHEMCHMWFGDLVTPTWWDDTWLKESFAENQGTWAQAEATQWSDAWATFALGRKGWAYAEDSRPATTHPIMATVDDVEAARQTFDGITYAKGAAVLKQLVAYVGQEAFLTAARTWFADHAFGNADLTEFLDTLSAACGRDMRAWAQAWLGTAGPSILTTEIDTDAQAITCLRVRQCGVDLSDDAGGEILRPHTFVVGLYSFDDDGQLRRTHRLPIRLTERSVEVKEAEGLPIPDLITLNDEDLTYAVIRPDAASLACARTCLSRVADPLTRAVWWSTLDNLVRDGLLRPADHVLTVLSQAGDDTAAATLADLLMKARHYAVVYTSPQLRSQALQPLIGTDLDTAESSCDAWHLLLGAPAGSDSQLVRARAWIEAAGHARIMGDEVSSSAASRLRALLEQGLPGLRVDDDLRWRIMIALARLGQIEVAELDAALEADPSASGHTHHLQATSSLPLRDVKEWIFERILSDCALSNDHLDALIAGFAVPSHRDLTADFTPRYFEVVERVWGQAGQEIATRIVNGLFPSCGDESDLERAQAWLEEHQQAPAAVRRLISKGVDDLARALRAR